MKENPREALWGSDQLSNSFHTYRTIHYASTCCDERLKPKYFTGLPTELDLHPDIFILPRLEGPKLLGDNLELLNKP